MSYLINELNNFFSNQFIIVLLLLFFAFATYTDLKYLKIYNKFNLALLILRFALIYYLPLSWSHLFGAVVGFLVLTIPAVHLMHKMGGDIKFITILGLFLGLPLTIALLALSCAYM
ncbi:prepilin peptidase, partial [Clostridium disporicum]|uniref:prepilin peptidase n=1 Tax=Clostridium disporicum TaxID=84024 RepID=UPI0034A2CD4C